MQRLHAIFVSAALGVAAFAAAGHALPGADPAAPAKADSSVPAAAPAPVPAPEPAAAPPVAPATVPSAPAAPVPNEQLQAEVCALREDMRMLQSTLDLMVNKIMADLRDENEQLRQEIRRLNALRGMPEGAAGMAVPRPGGALVEQVLAEEDPVPAAPPPPPFKFTVVREWGRTAEDARQLGGEAQSLKGLIGVVPAGSQRADVEKLARDLRARYDKYDNINIEVFDDPVVAQAFAANKTADPEHRVLSVSRHKASGRDAIVLLSGGKGEMISLDPSAPPPPRQPDDLPTLSTTTKAPPAPKPAEPAQQADTAAAQDAPAMGLWQKSTEKKVHTKGSSKKRAAEKKDKKAEPEPEPVPVLVPAEAADVTDAAKPAEGAETAPQVIVPHETAAPETQVYEAPPGQPVAHEESAAEYDAASDTDGAGQEGGEKPDRSPKSNFGPKAKSRK